MDDKPTNNSKILMDINPNVTGTSLVVNKNVRTLEDLRKNFNPVQSSVLSEVRNFLPKLATANEELQKRLEADPDYSADIEQIDDEDAPHIEMNIAVMEADSGDDDSDGSVSSDNDSDDDLMCTELNENNIKMPTNGKANKLGKQLIQAMDDDSSNVHKDVLNEQTIASEGQNKT